MKFHYVFILALFGSGSLYSCPTYLRGCLARICCSCCRKEKKLQKRVTPSRKKFVIQVESAKEQKRYREVPTADKDTIFSPLAAWGRISNSISSGRFASVSSRRMSQPLRVTTAGIASIFDDYKYLFNVKYGQSIHINCKGCEKLSPVKYYWSIKRDGHFQKDCIEVMVDPDCFKPVWDQASSNTAIQTDFTLVIVVDMPQGLKPSSVIGSNDIASKNLSTFFNIPHPGYDISRFLMNFGADVLGKIGGRSWIVLRLLLIMRFVDKTHAICDCYDSKGDVLSRTIYL